MVLSTRLEARNCIVVSFARMINLKVKLYLEDGKVTFLKRQDAAIVPDTEVHRLKTNNVSYAQKSIALAIGFMRTTRTEMMNHAH